MSHISASSHLLSRRGSALWVSPSFITAEVNLKKKKKKMVNETELTCPCRVLVYTVK